MFKQTSPALREWKHYWEKDFYEWLMERPDPKYRRNWRFHGKQILPWFKQAYLTPAGSGCRGLFNQVLKCLDGAGGGHAYLPASNCVQELDNYYQCVNAAKKFEKHWGSVKDEYREHIDRHDTHEIKRTSWKQTRNLLKLWYGYPNSKRSRQTAHMGSIAGNQFPFFPESQYNPEAFDKRTSDDNHRAILKDAVFPHTPYLRGHLPMAEHAVRYDGRIPNHTPHAGMAGGVIAPPI
eukprot:TRINITY_DN19248_c0_g1_i1.p1 TRINITY_DN19248_c0_g1~~TRINITY_DN19248_c0_g1_i1.p1  ORF type:complete len:236 (+),score=58.26 TRINITY_DN19248_c0_g1_i1:66-773(+)